jgi:hypothetical protein
LRKLTLRGSAKILALHSRGGAEHGRDIGSVDRWRIRRHVLVPAAEERGLALISAFAVGVVMVCSIFS